MSGPIKSFTSKAQVTRRPDGMAVLTIHFGVAGITDEDAALLASSAEIAIATEVALVSASAEKI